MMTGREMLLLACIPAVASAAARCEGLAELKLSNTMITAAERVRAGAMAERSSPLAAALFSRLPALCRVRAMIRPAPDSEINIEVWMPEVGWNEKFLGV